MILGFTGTRRGLSSYQADVVRARIKDLLPQHPEFAVVHGACVGADCAFNRIAAELLVQRFIIWPSDIAGTERTEACVNTIKHYVPDAVIEVHAKHRPLERNRFIVHDSTLLLACPNTEWEEQRSGTWATVRVARKSGCPYELITP